MRDRESGLTLTRDRRKKLSCSGRVHPDRGAKASCFYHGARASRYAVAARPLHLHYSNTLQTLSEARYDVLMRSPILEYGQTQNRRSTGL